MAGSESNPKRLALWAIAGSIFAASTCFTTMLPVANINPYTRALFMAPLGVGLAAYLVAYRRLRRGHEQGLWAEDELASTRNLLVHPAWVWATLAVGALAILIVSFTDRHGTLIVTLMFPMNAITGMRRLLLPPEASSPLIAGRAKPLHSDHWGEEPHATGGPLPF